MSHVRCDVLWTNCYLPRGSICPHHSKYIKNCATCHRCVHPQFVGSNFYNIYIYILWVLPSNDKNKTTCKITHFSTRIEILHLRPNVIVMND